MKTHSTPLLASTTQDNGQGPKVLVPIDFSPESVQALRAAASAAEKAHGHLTLLNVIECGTIYRGLEVAGTSQRIKEDRGRRLADLVEAEVPASVPAELLVGCGKAENEITRVAGQRHMDCIVVGRHQRRRWFGGSTARKVAGTASCKVIVWQGGSDKLVLQPA